MNLIVTVLLTVPLGFFVKNRTAAYLTYIAFEAFILPVQTLWLLLEWINGDESAFGPYPVYDKAQAYSYGAVNLVIFVVGLGLVTLGARLAARRRGRAKAVSLDPVAG